MSGPGGNGLSLRVIARITSDFAGKFGIPRQSGMLDGLVSHVVFEPEYRDQNALRGLEGYSHIWLIWGFSEAERTGRTGRAGRTERTGRKEGGARFRPMVKPPRLGGNTRIGVFATRSPYRPNPIGLSSVRLLGMERRPGCGTVLLVEGADLMDGTPIYDIKPYLSFTDSHPDASCGFAEAGLHHGLEVVFAEELLQRIPPSKRSALLSALRLDPRPAYQDSADMPYAFTFAGLDVRFRVEAGVLTVFDVAKPQGHIK